MQSIDRSIGTTESERYLASIAEKTFLDLWSYPNLFTDRGRKKQGDGKELADLLVVFGDDVIVFSDKSIAWPSHPQTDVAWSRWYRRAVMKSVDQIRGAERWLREHPNRIYCDPGCEKPFPLALPPPDRIRFHGIAVALGAQAACSRYLQDDDGSLMIMSDLRGDDHIDPQSSHCMLFSFGDVAPEGSFIHVFDETALEVVLTELDTITDLTRYLNQRRELIRGGVLGIAPSEADLLAIYLSHDDERGYHRFPVPITLPERSPTRIVVEPGSYASLRSEPGYVAKKAADRASLAWDKLIGLFTKNVLAGTSVPIDGVPPSALQSETALRIMAAEDRVARRALSGGIIDAFRKSEQCGMQRFARVMIPEREEGATDVGYVFIILAYPKDTELPGGYEQYREARVRLMKAYCVTLLHDFPKLHTAVAVGVDASPKMSGREGGSEDLMMVQIDNWSDDLRREVIRYKQNLSVLDPDTMQHSRYTTQEFPAVLPENVSRQVRRAHERARRKASRM